MKNKESLCRSVVMCDILAFAIVKMSNYLLSWSGFHVVIIIMNSLIKPLLVSEILN